MPTLNLHKPTQATTTFFLQKFYLKNASKVFAIQLANLQSPQAGNDGLASHLINAWVNIKS